MDEQIKRRKQKGTALKMEKKELNQKLILIIEFNNTGAP